MKTKQRILELLTISLLCLIACSKPSTKPTPANPLSLSATIDSANVKTFIWQTSSISSTNSGGMLIITALKNDGTAMIIKMPYPISLGSNPTANWQTYDVSYYLSPGVTFQPATGLVGVTSYTNGILEGTFSGTMYNYNVSGNIPEIDISSGTFIVNVQ